MARVLVACEYSGVIREAFKKAGHEAMSCDLLSTEIDGWHYQGDVFDVINDGWDMMMAHPPCTHLATSGARWFKDKGDVQEEALRFVQRLLEAPIRHICLENPKSIISSRIRKPDQIIQPWMFGDPFTKTTCLWTKNLPLLVPTNIVEPGDKVVFKSGKSMPAWYNLSPGPERAKLRSKTFQGMADAIGTQYGEFLKQQ